LQAFDFVEANFAILIVFEFFLMTTEYAEIFISNSPPQRPQPLRGELFGTSVIGKGVKDEAKN
jgi:hypothetical protein